MPTHLNSWLSSSEPPKSNALLKLRLVYLHLVRLGLDFKRWWISRVRRVDRVWWRVIFVRRFSWVMSFLGAAAQGVCVCFGVGFGRGTSSHLGRIDS